MYRLRSAWSAGVVAAVLLGHATGAYASVDDGDWYYDGLDHIHQQADGAGIQVAIIDTQVESSVPELANTDLHTTDHVYCWDRNQNVLPLAATGEEHGTSIAAIIMGSGSGLDGLPGIEGVAPAVSLYSYPLMFLTDVAAGEDCGLSTEQGLNAHEWAFRDALDQGADIINISAQLNISDELIAEAVASGVIVVAAAGNSNDQGINTPANRNGVVAVGSYGSGSAASDFNPSGPEMGVLAPGEDIRTYNSDLTGYQVTYGSSMAAAYTSGALAVAWSAHPEATANQIEQLLVHNTGDSVGSHQPERNEQGGYGLVNVESMLADDPSEYDDVNPFITDDNANGPSTAMIESFGGTSSTASAAPSQASPTSMESEPSQSTGPGVRVVAVVVAAVVLTGTLAVAAFRRRRKTG